MLVILDGYIIVLVIDGHYCWFWAWFVTVGFIWGTYLLSSVIVGNVWYPFVSVGNYGLLSVIVG